MKVVITGTTSGIGRATAQKFLNHGYDVVGIDIKEPTINDPHYTHIVASIADKNLPDIENVDILVNNAGTQGKDEIDINLKGTINVTEKYGIQPNIKSIVFNISASSITGAEFPEYAASKGGIVTYMKNTALRVAEYGATSNGVSPGGVNTELNGHILNDPDLYKKVLNETLLHKWAEPEEIADLIYYLAAINKSMTGENILIDNGEALKSNFIW